jgi:hypothetical protein
MYSRMTLDLYTKNAGASCPGLANLNYQAFLFSHCWFAIPQLVLQADWQDVWHSPHPPFSSDLFMSLVFNVMICFIPTPLSENST